MIGGGLVVGFYSGIMGVIRVYRNKVDEQYDHFILFYCTTSFLCACRT